MDIDFSVLKNIDFTKPDNLLFLFIFLVIFLIAFLVFLFILIKIIKEVKKIVRRLFNLEAKKLTVKTDQKDDVDWLKGQLEGSEEPIGVPLQRVASADLIQNFRPAENPEEKDIVKIQKEREQKDITEGLSKFKSESSAGQSTVGSKMPSRTDSQDQEDDSHQKIIIPRAKRFYGGTSAPNVGAVEKTAFTTKQGTIQPAGVINTQYKAGVEGQVKVQIPGEPNSVKNIITSQFDYQIPGSKLKENKSIDQSIFNGQTEVSRIKLEHEMRKDPKIWQASKQVGLNMSPVERAKLVKQVFSSALGRNISKTDLNQSIKKLNQKMLSTKDSDEHAKIRKEIKFFKKIGGVK